MPAPLQKGTVLVASQDLQEEYFARTVILLTHHSDVDGTMGLMLNRPMVDQVQLDSADELRRFAESGPQGSSSIGHLFFEGGPVKRGYLFFWIYADSCGLILAFLGSGGRNAAMIFSLRYSSSR